ncbi:MAG: hypothetical protein NC388_02755 [Clostridium sp.]|nr:hypothetical protein [Clostridium sp.]
MSGCTKVILSTASLSLTYSREELKSVINHYAKSSNGSFSYKDLCNHIKTKALQENRFEKEKNTEYHGIALTGSDETLISKILWDMIWEKELFINFSRNPYLVPTSNDTYFNVNR